MFGSKAAAMAALFLFCCADVRAQVLTGIVSDPEGRPVAEARLELTPRGGGVPRVVESDDSGAYQFERLPAGGYLLEAAAADHELRRTLAVDHQGADQTLDVQLELVAQRTEVVVSSTFGPETVFESAKAVDVVTADEIERRNEFTLGEALRHLPGIRIKQQRGPGGFTKVQVRGQRNQDTALLIDGFRFRDAAGTQGDATAFYQDMNIVDASRVELLRGSGSSLYGTNAMAGVVNIVSDPGGGRPHGELRAEGGGLGFLRGTARAGGGAFDNQLLYSGGFSHVNVTDGVDGFDPHRNTSGHGFAKAFVNPKSSLSGRIWASDVFSALNESPTLPAEVVANHPASGPIPARGLAPDQVARFARGESFNPGNATFVPAFNDPDTRRTSAFLAYAVAFEQRPSPNVSWRASYSGVDTRRSFRDGPAGRSAFDPAFSSIARQEGRTDTLQLRGDIRRDVHHVTGGYEFEQESFSNFDTDENPDLSLRPNASAEVELRSNALFAQDQMRLLDGRLQIALSGRAQLFSLSTPTFSGTTNPYRGVAVDSPETALTGDVAAAYFFRESGTKFRAHFGNAYRAPSNYERFGSSFFFGEFNFWGDPRLSPERSTSIDFGIDQWLADDKLKVSATVFYTDLSETIVFDFGFIDSETDPFHRRGGYRNLGGALARGVEFSASAKPSRATTLTANYTYSNSDSDTPTVPGTDFRQMLGVSDHLVNLTAMQRIGRRLDVTFDLFWASDYPLRLFGASERLVFDGPLKADAVVSYTIPLADGPDLRFYGKIENLLDRTYFEDGFQTPGAWGVGGLEIRF